MRMQSISKSPTNVRFNYGATQSIKEPIHLANRPPAYTFAPPTVADNRWTLNTNVQSYRQTPTFNIPSSQIIVQGNQQAQQENYRNYSEYVNQQRPLGTKVQTKNISENSRFKVADIPEAKEDDFKPGCFSKGSKGVVFQSHESSKSYCC